MTDRRSPPALRELLPRAVLEVRPRRPLHVSVEGSTSLTRGNKSLGRLRAVLQLTLSDDEPTVASLMFEWPFSADTHPTVAPLLPWTKRHGRHRAPAGVEVDSRAVRITAGQAASDSGARVTVKFSPADTPEAMARLLALADQLGVAQSLAAQLAQADEAD